MLKRKFVGGIDHMGRVAKLEARKHQPVPQNPPDTNTILEISPTLTESGQGISQPKSFMFPRA